ncbi:transcriptional regulator, TetR family [Sphingomonas laterariae]|uniref:Transcriptional regulator, TetR family n=1 Tax=Edaphosphingomonas laterariae TaxID=861865 RepID=A0A239I0Q9_9SPHN|nr:TetR/AcrR family transcriptional regulator [Sphingomonas laterariae]SNS86898.1 transcriptional regulator, TetR family [Sphingomonas laterariae]
MTRKRLSSSDRRDSIIEAATGVFARSGFSGAKTLDIARAANVSEALVFRHFPNKVAIYRAVLRTIIRSQDETLKVLSGTTPDAGGIIDLLRRTFLHSLLGKDAHNAQGTRIYFSSLGGDGTYASLAYRRSMRLWLDPLAVAMEEARKAGDITGQPMPPHNAFIFIEHVSSIMLVSRTHEPGIIPYEGDDEQLLENAVRFCARGLGMTDAAIERHRDLMRTAAPDKAIDAPATPKAPARKTRSKAA